MTMRYSAGTRGFYCPDQDAPEDAVDVPPDVYAVLFEEQSKGRAIVPDKDGNPALLEVSTKAEKSK